MKKGVESYIAFLRLEGLVILAASLYLYGDIGYSWWWFVLGLLVPDITMVGYLFDKKIGAFVYNLGHSLVFPIFVAVMGYAHGTNAIIAIGLIWIAHVGMDRAFGYGLKKPTGFKHTHLGEIGK